MLFAAHRRVLQHTLDSRCKSDRFRASLFDQQRSHSSLKAAADISEADGRATLVSSARTAATNCAGNECIDAAAGAAHVLEGVGLERALQAGDVVAHLSCERHVGLGIDVLEVTLMRHALHTVASMGPQSTFPIVRRLPR